MGRILKTIAVILGVSILMSGLSWNSFFLPKVMDSAPSGGSGTGFSSFVGDDEVIMDGSIGFMSLIWDNLDGRDQDGKYPEISSFDNIKKDVYVTSNGVFERGSNKLLMDEFEQTSNEGQTFPPGGVKKRDYNIFNSALNRSVKVKFSGETEVFGRTGYIYTSDIEDVELESGFDSFSSGEMDGEFTDMISEMDILYSDTSSYILDPRTSIPFDIQLDISSSFIFPDSNLLTVMEEQVRYSEETIWVPTGSGLSRMEEINVIREIITKGIIDPENEMVGLYTLENIYYDANTGEPLPDELQGNTEEFAVDRTSYQYILGYKGTRRSGFYQFPVGNIMKKDYPMWDESLEAENIAEYSGESTIEGKDVYVYKMVTEGVVVEGGNALLPIYQHPGTTYELDTIQQWFIDIETGFMLDFRIDGTIKVSSSGPLGLVEQSVGSFSVDLPDNTTSELLEVSDLFRDLLLPMSGKKIEAFSLELSFSEKVQRILVDTADQVAMILDILENKIPNILLITGAIVILVSIAIFAVGIRRRRIRRAEAPSENEVYVAIIE